MSYNFIINSACTRERSGQTFSYGGVKYKIGTNAFDNFQWAVSSITPGDEGTIALTEDYTLTGVPGETESSVILPVNPIGNEIAVGDGLTLFIEDGLTNSGVISLDGVGLDGRYEDDEEQPQRAVISNSGTINFNSGYLNADFSGNGTISIATNLDANTEIRGTNNIVFDNSTRTVSDAIVEGKTISAKTLVLTNTKFTAAGTEGGTITVSANLRTYGDITINATALSVGGKISLGYNYGDGLGQAVTLKNSVFACNKVIDLTAEGFILGENDIDATISVSNREGWTLTIGEEDATTTLKNANLKVAEGGLVKVVGTNVLEDIGLEGTIALTDGAAVTATVTDASDDAAFYVGHHSVENPLPTSKTVPKPPTTGVVYPYVDKMTTNTKDVLADVVTFGGEASLVDLDVDGGTFNVLGTAVIGDVNNAVYDATIEVVGTTCTWQSSTKVKSIVHSTPTEKSKKLTGTVNVGTKDGKTTASLEADYITNGGVFNVYGSATLDAEDITNTGTLNFAKGSFVTVGDIDDDAETKTGTVTIASTAATINSITNQKSVSIASGANLSDVEAISDNTAVTITAASVEVNELLDNGTVTIGKGASTLTVEEFAGTITMADGAILADSVIGAADPESIEETDSVIHVGTAKGTLYKKGTEVNIGDGTGILSENVQTYKSNTATFSGDNLAAADLAIDGGTVNVNGLLVLDDVDLLANTLPGPNVTFKAGTEEGSAVVKSNGSAVSTLNIAAADEGFAVVEADDVTNAGAINVGTKAGLGSLDAVDFTNNGTVTVAAGSFLDTESFTNTKTLTLNGDGDLDDVTNSGTVTVAATGSLDADDVENTGTFNVKGTMIADTLTNKTTSSKKFEVTGRADIAEVDNAGVINVFGTMNVGTFTEVEGEEDPEFEGGTLTNVGTILVGATVGTVSYVGYLNAGEIINNVIPAVGEVGQEGYVPAVVGGITVAIGSSLNADTITNYATITVVSTDDGEAHGSLSANTIVNNEGATLRLAGTLGALATEEAEAQVLTISNLGGDVSFARVTNLQNVVLADGEFAVDANMKAYFDQLTIKDGANLSITSLYAADDAIKGTITIDALSSIACGDKTQFGIKSGTIVFDADVDPAAAVEAYTVVDGYVAEGVTLYLKQDGVIYENDPIAEDDYRAVTINGVDYTLIRRRDAITLTTQNTSKIYVNQAWKDYWKGYEFTWDIVNSDGTVTPTDLIYGFNAFGEFSDITYPAYNPEMPPKVPAARNVFLNAGTYDPQVVEEKKQRFFYTSDRDVVFDVNPILNPENPENDNYTVTLDTDRTYLMKPVNYSKVQTGYVDPEAEVLVPVYEYTVTDKDGNAITSAEQAPTFTIAENMVLTTGLLKAGDKLDDADTEAKSDWSMVAPAEEGDFPTFKPDRSGGIANLVIDGTVNAVIYTAPFSTVTISETGSTKNTAAAWSSSNNICVNASVTINGGKDTKTAEGYQAEVANVAFFDGGSLTINDSKVKISQIRYERLNGGDPIGVLEPTAASITLNNTVLETVADYTGFGNGDTKDQAVFFIPGINAASGYDKDEKISKLDVAIENKSNVVIQADFNPSEVTTVTISDSTLKANKLTNDGTIEAVNGAVIENKHDAGSLFTNNGEITLDDSVINHTWDYIYNYGTITATNGSVITGNIHNAATYIAAEDITIGSTLLVQDSTIAVDAEGGSGYFYNWWGSTVLVEDSVVSFTTLANAGSFTVTGESSLSISSYFHGKVDLVSANLTNSDIVKGTPEDQLVPGYLNIAANVPSVDPEADPVANEVTFAGGNAIDADIENAGKLTFSGTNTVAKVNNAEGATIDVGGTLNGVAFDENHGKITATNATINAALLKNYGTYEQDGGTFNLTGTVWSVGGTITLKGGANFNANINNSAKVEATSSTITGNITNNATGDFKATSSTIKGDITNNSTKFTANGGSITGNITNAANATFTMENGAKFVGAVKNPDNSYTEYSITNYGTFNLSNAKITELRSNRSKGATINNTDGGTFIVSGSDFEITAKSITTDAGDKFKVSGTGKLDVVTLSGRIRIDGDTTLNSAAIDNGAAGELYVASGKTLTLKADSTFKETTITNKGTITAQKALSTKKDNTHIGALDNQSNATVNVTGDMTVGTVSNDGTINASANVTTNAFTNKDGKTFNATGSGKTVTVNGDLSNSGAFGVTGNLATNGNAITNVKNNMTVGGTLKTTKQGGASGSVTITAGSITATGAMEVGDVANNGGTLTAKAGLKAGAVTNGDGKTIKVTGALNTTGKITNSGSLTADSVATNGKDIENVKNTFTVNGALSTTKQNAASGNVTITSGTIDVKNNGAVTIGALTVGVVNGGSGTLNGGSLTAGAVAVNRGTVSIAGAATVGALGVGDANSGTFKAASLKADDVTVTKGTVTISGAAKTKAITNSGTFSAASIDTQGKDITNNANATITVTGDLTTKKDNNYGAVANSGTFTVGGTVTSGAFTNNAGGTFTITAKKDAPVMTVNGDFSNAGTLTIDVKNLLTLTEGEQVKVVSVTGAVDAGNITLLNSDGSFKKIIQTTGDAKGIYLYKTNEIPSAPTIYVNSAWSANKPGDTIKFPTEKDTLTFGLDAFASTDSVDLAADTTALKIINRTSYNTLNIGKSLDVTIWDDTGLAPSTTAQIFEHLNVSGNETVASFQGQKISTTDATIAEDATLDLRSSAIMDRDPSTHHTGANATLKVTGAGKLLTDWNSTLNLSGSLLADGMLDIDLTGYSDGADVTIIRGYGQENHYKAAIGAAKYNKYFTVSGNDLKMNTQAREVLYVDSNYGNAITDAVNYTWNGNDGTTYHADTIVILGKSFSGSQYLEGIKDQTVIVRDGATFTALFGGVLQTTLGNKLTSLVEVDSELAKVDLHLQIDGATFNNVLVAGDRINLSKAAASENKGIFTRYGETNLTINSGTFNSWVVGGQYFQPATTSIAQIGGTNIVINGGTFKDIVYGGSLTSNISYSTLATVTGTTNVTINAGENDIDLKKLVVGSYGAGIIEGGTKLTLTGNLTDDDAASFKIGDIWGGSGSDKYDKDTHAYRGSVEGNRILSFTGFKGELGASSVGGFSNVVVDKNSSVKLNAGADALSYANKWEIEFAGNGATSISGAFENDLGNDTLTLTGIIDAMAAGDSWTVFGNDVTLTNYNTLGVVFDTGDAVNFADGGWDKGKFHLTYSTENGMVLTKNA